MRRVGVVTSWACRCGIAEYSRSLLRAVPSGRFEFIVLADEESGLQDNSGFVVERCWRRSSEDVSGILDAARRHGVELVIVEFNWGYLNPRPLGLLLKALVESNTPAIVQMHSTDNRVLHGETQSIASAADGLATAVAIIVHSAEDENRIHELVPGVPVERTQLGQTAVADDDILEVRRALGISDRAPILATFGFLFPHKGVVEILRAMQLVQEEHPLSAFLAVCSVVPSMKVSVDYWRRCELEIRTLGLEDTAALITEFLPDAAAMALLHAADVIVLPYLETGESASAAARFVLSARRPVVTSSAPVFDALGKAVYRIPRVTPEAIAEGVSVVIGDPRLRCDLQGAADQLSSQADWGVLGQRFADLLDRALSRVPMGTGAHA